METHGDTLFRNENGDPYRKIAAHPPYMRGRKGAALLLDTGSPSNLIGSVTSKEIEYYALESKRKQI